MSTQSRYWLTSSSSELFSQLADAEIYSKASETSEEDFTTNKRQQESFSNNSESENSDLVINQNHINNDISRQDAVNWSKATNKRQQLHIMTLNWKDLLITSDPESYAEVIRVTDSELWCLVINSEVKSLLMNKTWDVVSLLQRQQALTSKWVFKQKIESDEKVNRHKIRMIVCEFQQILEIDYEKMFAAVVKSSSYKILLMIAATLSWKCRKMNVKTAFLNSELEEEVYMKFSPGIQIARDKIYCLKKTLYELKQAEYTWYDKFCTTLEAWDWVISPYNECVFIHSELELYIALWVNDLLIFRKNNEDITFFQKQISNMFEMTDKEKCTYYLSMHI